MKQIELLAPAGSYEAFIAAILNGANAVYLGGSAFSARAFATNFTNQEIIDAVAYAHLRNVRVFVTVNTLYSDDQFPELYEYISFLYNENVDAVIIQDIGLLHMIKTCFPSFETHMSTQASIYNKEAAAYYESLGVNRIVLARENTIEEIKDICTNTPMDVEVFVHGALCMGYSGQCLFSSFLNDRSGNKGSCSQPCRLPYRLKLNKSDISKKNTFLLSPKDLCTIEYVEQLIDSGIHSFKIEGRMKRPEYVATIVKQYREAIDAVLQKQKVKDVDTKIYKMKTMFNRGFTKGHLFHDGNFLSGTFSGNKGLEVGKVVDYNQYKKMLSITLNHDIKQNDRFLFHSLDLPRTVTKLYYQGNLVNKGLKNQTIQIEMNQKVPVGEVVYRIYDSEQIKIASETYQKEHIQLPISMSFYVQDDYPMLQATYNEFVATVCSTIPVEVALKTSLSKDRIETQLKKLGNTIYYASNLNIDFPEGYTFAIKELNEMRRSVIENLSFQRLQNNRKADIQALYKPLQSVECLESDFITKIKTTDQLSVVLEYPIEEVYSPIELFMEVLSIYEENYKEIYLYTSFLTSKESILEVLENENFYRIKKVIVSDMRAYMLLKDHVLCILDSNHNVYNSYACDHYKNIPVILSKECTKDSMKHHQLQQETYLYVYGYMESMVLKHCIISQHYHGKKIVGCNACKKGNYTVSDGSKEFPVLVDKDCNNHLYHHEPLYMKKLDLYDIHHFILDFTIETTDQIQIIIESYIYH